MTGPFPGGYPPQSWDDRLNSPNLAGQPYESGPPVQPGQQETYPPGTYPPGTTSRFPYPGYGGGFYPGTPRPRKRAGQRIAIILAVVVVLAGGLVGAWLLLRGANNSAAPTLPAAGSTGLPLSGSMLPSASNPDDAAWTPGTCYYEEYAHGSGAFQLTQSPCDSDQAVFVINDVVQQDTQCARYGDFERHGYEDKDVTANVVYCVSLVVPVGGCYVSAVGADNTTTKPIERTTCGSASDVVEVQSVESAANVGSACSDVPHADVWLYQSPTSGRYACVKPAGG